ncbi:sulfatase [Flavobacteriaceae bacterium]|nr:sulfatase [Flavobacteriaceae bacterium]
MKYPYTTNKILFLPILLLIILGFGSQLEKDSTTDLNGEIEPKKQNILFISIDDLRPLINSYGADKMITPNFDKLASESLQFNNAFTNIAVCGGSRASIMTGIRPSEKRFNDYRSRASLEAPNAIPLNEIFKDNGYETISYGKIYHYLDDHKEHWSEIDNGAPQTDYQDPVSRQRKRNGEMGSHGNKGPAFEYPDVDDFAYTDGKITKKAIKKLKALKKANKPFFMALGYVSPHLPFIQPKKYWDLYEHDEISLPDNAYYPKDAPFVAIQSQHFSAELRNMYLDIPEKGNLDDELSRNLIHGYYASVSYLDAMIGELIKNLDEMGLRDSTTIVLWSDHGYFLGEHGFWCKHSTFYEAVKIPLFISSSQYPKNITTDSFTELVDIYPTLCQIAGITPPKYLHGESLIPVLQNPNTILKTEVYTRYKQGEAVIDKDFSYTEFYKGEKYMGNMLYDLHEDIKQNIDISEHKGNEEIVKKYSKMLKTIREKVNKNPI